MLLVRSLTLSCLMTQGLLALGNQPQIDSDPLSMEDHIRSPRVVSTPERAHRQSQSSVKAEVTQQQSSMFEESHSKDSAPKNKFGKDSTEEEPPVLPALKKKKSFGKKLVHEIEDLAPIVTGGVVAAATAASLGALARNRGVNPTVAVALASGASTAVFVETEKLIDKIRGKHGHDHHHDDEDDNDTPQEVQSILPPQTAQSKKVVQDNNWATSSNSTASTASAMAANANSATASASVPAGLSTGCCPGCQACPAALSQEMTRNQKSSSNQKQASSQRVNRDSEGSLPSTPRSSKIVNSSRAKTAEAAEAVESVEASEAAVTAFH